MSAVNGMAITSAYVYDDEAIATDIVKDLTDTETRAALHWCAIMLAGRWEVDAHEMGINVPEYVEHLAATVTRRHMELGG